MKYYLIAINIISFLAYALDKGLAKKKMYRIPEKTLLTLSIIGGCYLGLISMYMFHHKTKKKVFLITNIACIIIYTYLFFVK